MTLAKRCIDGFDLLKNLGAVPAAHFALQRLRNRVAPPELLTVRSRYAAFPLVCRRGTSDLDVFGQIFSHREYRCLDSVRDAGLIIDCGANVGFSSAYFLTQYPTAEVIAVEPDSGNFAALQRNLAPYGSRAKPLRAGIWWRSAGLMVTDSAYAGDGREWARGVREATGGETPEVHAVDIGTLFDKSGHDRISILKIDIEGSEEAVFAAPCPWLERVDNLVIELHGPSCETSFRRALDGHGFKMSTCDELVVCMR